ncbi:MAG: T9SS type A sorting domain-containing protein [Ignavibacteria bacterium]|nr:T9SS type A sorting domain-containing protein [Ignavibacteria bacterium]
MKFKAIVILFEFIILVNQFYSQDTWIEQQSGVNVSLNCATSFYSSPPAVHGWICGNNGTVLSTTNGGTNWNNVSSGIPVSVNLTTIYGFTNDYSRAVTSGVNNSGQAVIYRTSNGGQTWQNTFIQPNGNIYGFAELSPFPQNMLLIGKPVGGRWTIWRSTNEGITWDSSGLYMPQTGSETGFNNSVFCLEMKVWFGTNNSRIYYSSNIGYNWIMQSTYPVVNSTNIWFQFLLTERAVGYGLSGSNAILKTNDLGASWQPVFTLPSGEITGISGLPSQPNKNWYCIDNKIFEGTNGVNWNLQYTAPGGNYTHISNNKNTMSNIWAVRNNGGISKFIRSTGINYISTEIPESFSLSQNYPNPFNPTTNFEFSIPLLRGVSEGRGVFVNLTIYDAMGRVVETLHNGELKSGIYKADWNASNFPSGVYFYRLSAVSFSETKKMILTK